MEKEKTTSIRLDPRYYAGIEIAIQLKKAEGFARPTLHDVIRDALNEYFENRDITTDDIKGILSKELIE